MPWRLASLGTSVLLAATATWSYDEHYDAYVTLHTKSPGDGATEGVSLSDIFARTSQYQNFGQGEGRKQAHVLGIGCGFSMLPEEMAIEGWGSITCIDINSDAVAWMRKHWKSSLPATVSSRLKYVEGDVFNTTYVKRLLDDAVRFDMILDKGLLELMPESGKVDSLFDMFHDLLTPKGVFVQVGPFAPHGMDDQGWRLDGAWAPSTWPEWQASTKGAQERRRIVAPQDEPVDESETQDSTITSLPSSMASKVGKSWWTLVEVVGMTNTNEYVNHPPTLWTYVAQRVDRVYGRKGTNDATTGKEL